MIEVITGSLEDWKIYKVWSDLSQALSGPLTEETQTC